MNPNNQQNSIELPDPVGAPTDPVVPVSDHGNGNVQFGHINTQSQQPIQSGAAPLQQAPVVDSGLIADDVDLIEKDWVIKAKSIVNQTMHDPNMQSKELQKMKAEYIKKRYNKDLKTDGQN